MFKDTFLQQILFSPRPILYRIFHPYILNILSYLQFDCLKVLGLSAPVSEKKYSEGKRGCSLKHTPDFSKYMIPEWLMGLCNN